MICNKPLKFEESKQSHASHCRKNARDKFCTFIFEKSGRPCTYRTWNPKYLAAHAKLHLIPALPDGGEPVIPTPQHLFTLEKSKKLMELGQTQKEAQDSCVKIFPRLTNEELLIWIDRAEAAEAEFLVSSSLNIYLIFS